jgi:hypothetical protein
MKTKFNEFLLEYISNDKNTYYNLSKILDKIKFKLLKNFNFKFKQYDFSDSKNMILYIII